MEARVTENPEVSRRDPPAATTVSRFSGFPTDKRAPPTYFGAKTGS